MRRLAKLVVFVIACAAVWWYFFGQKPPVGPSYTNPDVWAGDQESGCMYPVAEVMDGKDPVWWSESRRQWNQFESKQAAMAAGYHACSK